MATLAATLPTLADRLSRTNNGKLAAVIELLSQLNEILFDIPWIEANSMASHKSTQRTGIPAGTWRQINQGVDPVKSQTAQVTDVCGQLSNYSNIDLTLYKLNGESNEFRLSEDMGILEGMAQQMASAYIYSNAISSPAQIMGLAPRYPTVSTANSNSAANVIDCGGTGSDNTSVWLVCWGPRTAFGIYPKGLPAGLQVDDRGRQWAYDSDSKRFEAMVTYFEWNVGLAVPDWRYVVRMANIDVSDLIAGTGVNLINAMIRAIHRLPTQPASAGTEQRLGGPKSEYGAADLGNCVFYCNRTVRTYLDIQAANKSNSLLRIDEYAGKPRTTFLGIPVRTVDAILNTEAQLT